MIKSFRHKGLKRYFERTDSRGLSSTMVSRISLILDVLEAAESPQDVSAPGFGLHELKGDRKGTWSVSVTSNYRITFEFEGTDVTHVDLEDYH